MDRKPRIGYRDEAKKLLSNILLSLALFFSAQSLESRRRSMPGTSQWSRIEEHVDFDSDSMTTEHCIGLYLFRLDENYCRPYHCEIISGELGRVHFRSNFPLNITFYLYLTKTDHRKFFATFVCKLKKLFLIKNVNVDKILFKKFVLSCAIMELIFI